MNNKLLAYLFLMLPALLMTSCLKDQEDVFEKPASIRSAEYLENAKNVLTSAENGWVMNYYPDNLQSYGGFSYVLKFDNKTVTAYYVNGKYELKQAGDGSTVNVPIPETTTYALTNEDGPCIAFDTYNDYLHYFATPSASAYEAMGGDFIFIILNISEDKNVITLKGNRSGNLINLYRNTMTPEEYISRNREVIDTQLYEVFVNDNVTMTLDLESQQASIIVGEESEDQAFILTDRGLKLYQPVTVAGKTFDSFAYDADNNTYTSDDNTSMVLTGTLPEGWQSYEDLAGTYSVGDHNITVKTNGDGQTYTISGMAEGITGNITATYKYTTGSFVLSPQYIGMYAGTYYIWLLAHSAEGGLSWDESIKFKGHNSNTEPLTITFVASGYDTCWAGAFEEDPPTGDSYAGYWEQYSTPMTFVRVK